MLSITLFGSPTVTAAAQPVAGFVSSKAAALLYYLAATQLSHSRDALAALLWPDTVTETAQKNLRDILSNLRRLVEPYLSITRNEPGLAWEAGITVDYADFLRQLAAAATLQSATERNTRLAAAAALYKGDLLAGFHLQEAEPFETWLTSEREHARQRMLQTLHQLVDHAIQAGAFVEGIDYATRLLTLEPWEEQSHRDLMRLLAQSGQRGAALAQYEQCRRILAEELGVEPAEETVALYEHLLAASDAPLHNLPAEAHLEPLLGRSTEVAEIMRLLAQGACRLLTLIGLGGMGKTRLAMQVARLNLSRFWDGVYWVALSGVDAPALLVSAIGDALGFTFPGREPPKRQLFNFLRNKNLLLVLDSFEQLLPSSMASRSEPQIALAVGLLSELMQAADGVKLLVTSRERLNLRTEWLFTVIGLPIPTTGDSGQGEGQAAVQLFIHSARRVATGFTPDPEQLTQIARICQLVEGLPLAIELAASWTPVLTCAEIVNELERSLEILAAPLQDAPAQQRNIRAVFDYAWRMLSQDDQQVLAKLVVFQGGFRKEAAQAVAGAALLHLARLVNQSLLQHTVHGRYAIHELLRQYVRSTVSTPTDEHSPHAAHARYYLTWLHKLAGPGMERAGLDAIGEEIDNLRMAWQWAVQHHEASLLGNAAHPLYRFYRMRNWFSEGESIFHQAAISLMDATDSLAYAKIAARQAIFCHQLGDDPKARGLLDQSIVIADQLGDRSERAFAQLGLAAIALRQGDYMDAQKTARISLEAYQTLHDGHGAMKAHNCLADALTKAGSYQEAANHLDQALTLAYQHPMPALEAESRHLLGAICWNQGDYSSAQANYERARELYGDPLVANRQGEAEALNQLGFVAWSQGDYVGSTTTFHDALRLFRQIGDRQGEGRVLDNLGRVVERQGNYREAQAHYEQSLRISRAIGDRTGEGITLTSLGFLALHQGDEIAAQGRFANALQVNSATGHRHWEGLALACLGLLAYRQGEHGAVQTLSQQALELAHSIGDRPIMGYALTHLGYALLGLGRLDEAEQHFNQAVTLRTSMGDLDRATEALAGLAQIAWQRGKPALALQATEQIWRFLQNNNLERTLMPLQIYATCYQVLSAHHDPRSQELLAAARQLLQRRAAAIPNQQRRLAFLQRHAF